LTALAFPGVSMRAVEAKLQAAVALNLTKNNISGIDVDMKGQRAILSGNVLSPDAITAIEKVALTAAGPGGQALGGVTRVDVAGVKVVNVDALPFTWGARKSPAGVELTGAAPDERARTRLLQAARAAFKTDVTDKMTVRAGAPGGDWTAVAEGALQQLARLTRGQARLNDTGLSITGEADQITKGLVEEHFQKALPAPYKVVSMDILVDGQPVPVRGLENLNLAEASDTTCNRAFNELTRDRAIEFASGSAAINPVSDALLQDLGRVARRCDQYGIRIVGHTDDEGDAAFNKELSLKRAREVRNRLIELGMGAERLAIDGVGEESPIDKGVTPQARQRNRRIEFTVAK
jgi:outer membrane protein OmpA-like peptidoglycan-associated protein